MDELNRFNNKTAIITGGGGFIARATALLLASGGCRLVLCDSNIESANAVAAQVIENGGDAIACKTDVTKPDDARNAVSKAIEKYGKVDILICCAGGSNREKACYFCDQNEEIIKKKYRD